MSQGSSNEHAHGIPRLTHSAQLSELSTCTRNDIEEHERPAAASDLFAYIRENELGTDMPIQTPFGVRQVLYADYTASGRSLSFIEDYVRAVLLPTYGNTHTSTTKTGRQSSDFVAEARLIIKNALRCNKNDRLLFTGAGATAGANRLVAMLGLVAPTPGARAEARSLPAHQRPIVFVGPYEHHSNLLPWRDSVADVLQIGEAMDGGPDLAQLEVELQRAATRPLRIGAFSAASNVTGILTDVERVTALLKSHGALAIWDYASAAPYGKNFEMNPPHADAEVKALLEKDAIFFSPHKFAGGPQSVGVLIYKKSLCARGSSSAPGGGTVFYVSAERPQIYLKQDEEREEGGTPQIIGSIRVGLVLQLQRAVSATAIAQAEELICRTIQTAWRRHPNIIILGNQLAHRLPIFSFAIRCGGLYLHHNYVVVLLNDLFGIQARGGCMCAGPYSQRLLGIDEQISQRIEDELVKKEDNEILRPGYTRLSLAYFCSTEQLEFAIDAVLFIADHGFKILPQYTCDAGSGEWRHMHQRRPPRAWLGQISYSSGRMAWDGVATSAASSRAAVDHAAEQPFTFAQRAKAALAEATAHVAVAASEMKRNSTSLAYGQGAEVLSPEAAPLRWFLLPAEAANLLRGQPLDAQSPFHPPVPAFANTVSAAFRGVSIEDSSCSTHDALATDDIDNAVQRSTSDMDDHHVVNSHAKPTRSKKVKRDDRLCKHVSDGWYEPHRKMSNKVLRAVLQHGMLRPGDRVLLGLSGGKDSLCLLHVLRSLQARTPFHWELGACTVDPGADGFDPSPLIPYCERLGVPYYYEKHNFLEMADACMAKEGNRVSICSFCSRMKRGVLYATARREGYNVLAMAQHLDDLAESFLMSALHNGALRSMKAHYTIDAQDLRVIRPLAYVRESEAEAFSEMAQLPIVPENCPACFEAPKERYRVKCLLATQEALFPNLFQAILKTLLPLTEPHIEDLLRLRRESYGRINGPPHVPPPINPPTQQDQQAAVLAQATHGQYDSRAAWIASMALSRQRLAGGGRGISQKGTFGPDSACADELGSSWFGGTIDENGRFVRSVHSGSTTLAKVAAVDAAKHNAPVECQASKCGLETAELPDKEMEEAIFSFDTSSRAQERWDEVKDQSAVCQIRNKDAWEKAISEAGARAVVVSYSAVWCVPCKTIAPVFEQLARKETKFVFLKVDVDEAEHIASEHGVCSIPTFQVYQRGIKIDEVLGDDVKKLEGLVDSIHDKMNE